MLDYKNTIEKIDGWLTEREANFLYNAAKEIRSQRSIVEIGSWKGKSTICLGKGVQDGSRKTKIYAIDPHVGSSEHQRKFHHPIDTYQECIANIKDAGVSQYIELIRKTSQEASKNFHEPIGFLFIDGAHEFKFVNLDYRLWFPKVVDQGKIAFHDTWHFPGPHLVTAGMLLFSSKIKNPKLIDTITYFTKVEKNSFSDKIYNVLFFFYKFIFGICGFLRLMKKSSFEGIKK